LRAGRTALDLLTKPDLPVAHGATLPSVTGAKSWQGRRLKREAPRGRARVARSAKQSPGTGHLERNSRWAFSAKASGHRRERWSWRTLTGIGKTVSPKHRPLWDTICSCDFGPHCGCSRGGVGNFGILPPKKVFLPRIGVLREGATAVSTGARLWFSQNPMVGRDAWHKSAACGPASRKPGLENP
jgi:hypothetical protein